MQTFRLRFPLRLHFWLIAALLVLLYYARYYFGQQEELVTVTYFYILIALLLKIAFYFVLGMAVMATLSVVFSYLTFQFGKKKHFQHLLQAKSEAAGQGMIQGKIPFYLRPLLGKIQAIIYYKGDTEGITFIQQLPTGNFTIPFPVRHIKFYEVEELDILFLDFLRMYRLPASLHSIASFAKTPVEGLHSQEGFLPQKFQEEISHTDRIIYNKGEWLQYKPFESGDDVRRVIWKLYAKSKELMVRQQELYTHYSSKISVMAVFDIDEQFVKSLPEIALQSLLDVFKNEVFTIYQHLLKSNKEVSFAILGKGQAASAIEVQQQLTAVKWHQASNDRYDIPSTSFLILHSMLPDAFLHTLQEQALQHKSRTVIPLLAALPIRKRKQLLWHLFFKENKQQQGAINALLPSSRTLEKLQEKEKENLQTLLNF